MAHHTERRRMLGGRWLARAAVVVSCTSFLSGGYETAARADASLTDKAAAQVLFDEGRKLMAAGKFNEACQKLAESQKLDPGVGTQFNLADCYERIGQTTSAWAGFLEAAAGAKAMGQADREKVAKERAAALVPRLSKLTIASSDASVSGLEVKRDGATIDRALWGTAIPVDPGSHSIEATAPGKKTWQSTVVVEADKGNVTVTIPALEDAAAQVASPATSADIVAPKSSRRTLGLVVAGTGVVALGVGTVFAVKAKSKYDDSLQSCRMDDNDKCSQDGITLREDARSAGNLATLFVGAGAAALVAGAVLFLTAPSPSDKPHALFVPSVAPNAAGFAVVGTY